MKKQHRPVVVKAGDEARSAEEGLGAVPEAPSKQLTRSQKLRNAGFTRRKTWKSLPKEE